MVKQIRSVTDYYILPCAYNRQWKDMELVNTGEPAPLFCLPDSGKSEICLESFRGRWVVLYFYPKDNTPGCTLEARMFSEEIDDFRAMNTVIIGISPDSCESHDKFGKKNWLELFLLSDENHEVLKKYWVWQPRKLYGREFLGVVRTTYLINPDGVIAEVWPKVKVKSHAEAVKEKVRDLTGEWWRDLLPGALFFSSHVNAVFKTYNLSENKPDFAGNGRFIYSRNKHPIR